MPRKPKTIVPRPVDLEKQPSLFDVTATDGVAHLGLPGVAVEVSSEESAMMIAFKENARSFEEVLDGQDSPEIVRSSPWEAHRQRIDRLREHHRVLSELIVSTNRDIARIVAKVGSV